MTSPTPGTPDPEPTILVHPRPALRARLPALADYLYSIPGPVALSRHPRWLDVLRAAFGHEAYAVEAVSAGKTVGFLPLAHVSSLLFGRFLVSLPYLNTNGVAADSPEVAARLVSRAVTLADELGVRHLELRHEQPLDHPGLNAAVTTKVHMRLPLPGSPDRLWKSFNPSVRNQVRKGEKNNFAVAWGGVDLLDAFHSVLSRNMRDLGTPVYGRDLFREVLAAFPGDAELCVVRDGERPVAAALLLHGRGLTEVPTASSLKEYNPSCVNMLMYWRLLERSAARGQQVFDFGRSTLDSNTFKFKKQWGAAPHPAVWQYHVRLGEPDDMRPGHPRYQRAIQLWRKLPLPVTRLLGPMIVRGIP